MSDAPEFVNPGQPRVPARQVFLSASALWLCYFLLITVRGLVVELGQFEELLWRRALVTLAGIAITVLAWPLLRRFDGRSLGIRVAAALVIMLPAALALAFINQLAFAPVEQRIIEQIAREQAQGTPKHAATIETPKVRIHRDMAGNVLVDVMDDPVVPVPPEPPAPPARTVPQEPPAPPAPPRSPVPSVPGQDAAPPAPPVPPASSQTVTPPPHAVTTKGPDGSTEVRVPGVVIRKGADGSAEVRAPGMVIRGSADEDAAESGTPSSVASDTRVEIIKKKVADEGLWRQLTDVALGRYFLLIAWAALYLALGNAEQARAAEWREGEYRRAAKNAELRSLRYQVNPHFLFNTLNSLSALVMTGRAEQAERMIQTISSFYRHSLAADPTSDVPLIDEIALQRHYLDIEAVRFPDRLRTEFIIPQALEFACVPGMILQPLVENSIRYAVSATSRPVTIRITARQAEGLLVITVADDGPGSEDHPGGTGIGLANVRSRLAARFGDSARVDSGPLPAGGYATVLTLPIIRNDC